jgi:hypothetical protein
MVDYIKYTDNNLERIKKINLINVWFPKLKVDFNELVVFLRAHDFALVQT